MSTLKVFEETAHYLSHATRALNEIIFFVDCNRCQRCGTSKRVAVICQTTVEHVLLKMICDVSSHSNGAELNIGTRQTLSHRDQIGFDVPVVNGEPCSGSSKTCHHFISNQKDAVLVTQVSESL